MRRPPSFLHQDKELAPTAKMIFEPGYRYYSR